MLPSLYAAISGLSANQQKLNVIANNISNASTTGFKSQSMVFADMMSQNTSDPSAPVDGGIGGVNGKQSGLGVKISGICANFTCGSQQTTNRNLDFMIDTSGNYFVVSPNGDTTDDTGGDTTASKTYYYTRDGAFNLDKEGNLLTQDGNHVMGYNVDVKTGKVTDAASDSGTILPAKVLKIGQYYDDQGNIIKDEDASSLSEADKNADKVTSFSVGKTGTINVKTTNGSYNVGQIALATFQNEGGLVKQGGNLYKDSPNSGDATYGSPGASGYGSLVQGSLEMSNVDLAQQFTDMIIASRAFAANGKIITTDDEILQDLVNLKR